MDSERDHRRSTEARRLAHAYESPAAVNRYGSGDLALFPHEDVLIEEFFTTAHPILDLGCGGGRTSAALAQRGFRVVGIDLSFALLDAARSRVPGVGFCQADVRQLPFADGEFKQILFSFNGLDYVHPREDVLAALKEIARVISPDGLFIYSGHNIVGRFGRHLRTLPEFLRAAFLVQPGFLLMQWRGSQVPNWYWRYPSPMGELVAFSAPPRVHLQMQRDAGLEPVSMRGRGNERSPRWLTWREHHVQYVARKSIRRPTGEGGPAARV